MRVRTANDNRDGRSVAEPRFERSVSQHHSLYGTFPLCHGACLLGRP